LIINFVFHFSSRYFQVSEGVEDALLPDRTQVRMCKEGFNWKEQTLESVQFVKVKKWKKIQVCV